MTADRQAVTVARHARLRDNVCERSRRYADEQRGPDRAEYLALCQQLGHWLRHNGLRQTLAYLQMLADPQQTRNKAAARDLLQDWWHHAGNRAVPLSLSMLLATPDATAASARDYLLSSRLALREADVLKRAAVIEMGIADAQADTNVNAGDDTHLDTGANHRLQSEEPHAED